ncbi:MAG TPA: nucleotide exchange factor GrpE [Victivallales bacterium]|nr:nucleotide exchange factor GrpE [Victivallales bacterium]
MSLSEKDKKIKEIKINDIDKDEDSIPVDEELETQEEDLLTEEEIKIEELEDSVEDLKDKLTLSVDKFLRLNAEFENFRKRSVREKTDARVNAQFDTVSAVLPVIDHFELALASAEKSDNFNALLDGMKLIKDEFEKSLSSLGIEPINAVGETFDPNLHEAIANEPSEDFDKDVVSKQWRTGYKYGERLLRPATVVVSSGNEEDSE